MADKHTEDELECEHSPLESNASKGDCMGSEQEYTQESCKFHETPKKEVGKDDLSLVSDRYSTVQELTATNLAVDCVEQISKHFLQLGGHPQNKDIQGFSLTNPVTKQDKNEQESEAVNSDFERDLASTGGDRISSQQEQMSTMPGLSDHVVSAVPHDRVICASIPLEHSIFNTSEEPVDKTARNPFGCGVQVHNDVSISLNSPSVSEHVLPVSEPPANTSLCLDVNIAQAVPEISTGVADKREEDQVPTACVYAPDELAQGQSELCVLSVRSLAHDCLSDDFVRIENSDAMESGVQHSHSCTSFIPAEQAHTESEAHTEPDVAVSVSALTSVKITEEPRDSACAHAQTQSSQIISAGENSNVGGTSRANITTTITKEGKKRRVRIVIVKGEWRKPKTKVKNQNLVCSVEQDLRPNAIKQTRLSSAVSSVSTSSAIPTALFRNVHIKTEPAYEGYSEKRLTSETQLLCLPLTSPISQHEVSLESAGISLSQFSEMPLRVAEAYTESSAMSSSQFSKQVDQRRRGRRRVRSPSNKTSQRQSSDTSSEVQTSSRMLWEQTLSSSDFQEQTSSSPTSKSQTSSSQASSGHMSSWRTSWGQNSSGRTSWGQTSVIKTSHGKTSTKTVPASEASEELEATPENTVVKSRIQSCSVVLRRLPSYIETAGMVDLKTESQLLQDAAVWAVSTRLRKRPRDSLRPWECKLCGKAYKTKSARTQHYKVHLGLREHVCTICGAEFVYKSVLTSHYRFVHLKEKPHECPVCGKRFGWSSHLGVHLSRHYEDKPYTCPICHQDFNIFYIKKHLETHSNTKTFKCKICKGEYRSKNGLQEHMKIHSGLKPFKCKLCGQKFPYRNSLVSHMRTHTGERPFACPKCPSTFTQSTHLRTHLKGVHRVKTFPSHRRKEFVERVFRNPPANISRDTFKLISYALSHVNLLEKKQIKSSVAEEVSTVNDVMASEVSTEKDIMDADIFTENSVVAAEVSTENVVVAGVSTENDMAAKVSTENDVTDIFEPVQKDRNDCSGN